MKTTIARVLDEGLPVVGIRRHDNRIVPGGVGQQIGSRKPVLVLDHGRTLVPVTPSSEHNFVLAKEEQMGKTGRVLSAEERARKRAKADARKEAKRARDRAIRESMKGGQGGRKK